MSEQPKTLGTYAVERELGRGGMGVVYLARDPRLDRSVAIKLLPDAFARDPERLARFEREARLLASLNHPNIAGIHGVEEAGGHRLLVLEYVPGDALSLRTERGPLPIDDALDICRQIAAAVEAAHEGGVVHRDLKPANVKITPDGTVKVLDFGLAKSGTGPSTGSEPDLTRSPTLALAATAEGVILGTAAYMSPEQARGKPVDKRTDIWSFGCVLYECLTGRQIFMGETVSDMIAKILEREPDWAALPAQTPAKVRDLLHRCLDKDPKKRLRDIGDARIELEQALDARSSATRTAAAAAQARTRAALSPRAMGLAALLIVAGAAAGIGLWSALGPDGTGGRGAGRGPVRLSIGIPKTIRAIYAGLTPDGRGILVYGSGRRADGTDEPYLRLYARRLDRYELEAVPGTERVQYGTLSPDGRWLAFLATISEESSQRRLAKVPIDGSSPPVTLTDWDEAWSASFQWLQDGDILIFSDNSTRLVRVPSGGGPPKPAIPLDTGGVSAGFGPGNLLPGGRALFLSAGLWGARGYQQDQWLLDVKSGKAHRLIENAGNARYLRAGQLVFTRGEALMAVPFDLGRLEIQGDMVALLGGVRTPNSWDHGIFSISDDGSLLYPPGGRVGTNRQLVMVDAAASVAPFTSERRPYETSPAVSWDGRKVAVVVPNAKGTYEVWVADLGHPGLRRMLTLPTADCAAPLWSPDGQRLAYRRTARDQDDGIYIQRADGTGSPQPVLKRESQEVSLDPSSWAPDGLGLLVTKGVGGKGDILFLPLLASGRAGKPLPLRATPYDESSARFSPDGRLVAYTSDESGKYEVYVAGYGADGTLGPPLMVSSGGGYRPAWSGTAGASSTGTTRTS